MGICVGLAALSGCSPSPIGQNEVSNALAAPQPSSEAAAHAAAVAYFNSSLFDPEAARWKFLPLKNSVFAISFMGRGVLDENGYIRNHGNRAAGWFMCGLINGKNRFGGYTGDQPFFVYFSPTARDVIAEGDVGDAAAAVCSAIYKAT
jgi:hypothetical protein